MMDIDRKLEEILIKYCIIENVSVEDAIKYLQKENSTIHEYTRVGLYGAGKEADILCGILETNMPNLKIDVVFDRAVTEYEYRKVVKNKKVDLIDNINKYNLDVIFIGSFKYHKIFRDNLEKLEYKGRIIDTYEYLEKDWQSYIWNHFADYEMIYNDKKAYDEAIGKEKEIILKKIIKEYLLIRDFDSAERYINLYIEKQYEDYENYSLVLMEIQILLKEIKIKLSERKQKDIILNWVDAISYNEIGKFPYLNSIKETGCSFQYAYTVIPWTTSALHTIMDGELPIEGKTFLKKNFSTEDTSLLGILKQNNYIFAYYGIPRIENKFERTAYSYDKVYWNKYRSSVLEQWRVLRLMCETEEPVFAIVHTFYETHGPFISGEANTFIDFGEKLEDWNNPLCQNQAIMSGEYIDRQLKYYSEFYGGNVIKIYMGDHGRVGNCPMQDDKVHVMFMLQHDSLVNKKVDRLFSLVEFPQFIQCILENKFEDFINDEKEYVLIQNYDAYDKIVIDKIKQGILVKHDMLQCRGIITKEDKYFVYANGDKYYFRGVEENKNLIDCSCYKKRIEYLKELCGNEFIDIEQYEKFKLSKWLYGNI